MDLCDDSLANYLTQIKGSEANLASYNVSLNGNIIGFSKVSNAIQTYNNMLGSSSKEQKEFINGISVTNGKLGNYLSSLNGAKGSLVGYGVSLVGATVKTFALEAATMALNAALTWGVSFIVTGVITAISNWIRKEEILAEKAQAAQDKIKDLNDTFKTHQQLISDSAKRYAELAQGVDQISGKNISLNNDDYEEFLNLSNQLADAFPTLSRNYTENGDAIVQLSGDVDTIVGSLQSLIEAERQLKNQQIADELPTIFKNAASKSNAYNDEIDRLIAKRDTLLQGLDSVTSDNFGKLFENGLDSKYLEIISKDIDEYIKIESDYQKILDDAKIAYDSITQDPIHTGEFDSSGNEILEYKTSIYIYPSVTDEEINKAKKSIKSTTDALATEYENDIKDLNSQINNIVAQNKSNWTSLSSSLAAWLNTEDSYKIMSDDMQATVQNIVNSLDWSKLDFSSWDDAKEYIKDNILNLYKTDDGKEILKNIEVLFDIQTQFNNGEVTVKEYQEKLSSFLTTIQNLDPETQKAIKLLFGISTDDDGNIASDVDTMVNNVGNKIQDKFKDKVGSLTLDDLKIASTLEVPEGTLLSWDGLIQKIKETKNALPDETPISFVKSMTEVEKSKTGFDLIDKIYADVKNKEEFDWTSILNNTSFTETFGNMENVTEEYKSVYDEFIETVSNSPSDIDKCQKAFNRLTTAYLQNEGTLSAITDQSKEAAILYLQEQGVVNATEVVYASLLKTKLESEEASIAVANGTASEINSLLTEGAVTEETAQKLAAYALHKSLVNTETIDTAADCENVMRLAKVAGASVEALSQLDALKQRLADNPIMSEEMRKTITNKIKSIVSDVESSAVVSIDVPEVDYKGGSTTQKAADSAKKTADDLYNDLKEQIDAYMDYMEKSLDAGKIDYNTYCSSVKNYLDDLYNSGKLKAKDYFDYTEKMLNKQKDIYDKVISAVVNRLEEEADKWQEKIDELESANDKLNDNLSNMDSALDAIDRVYDNEIDRIQAIIDGLKDANDERDRTLALEKAKYELEKAYSQKVKKLYVEGKGFIYTPDYDAIKDAQSSYDDAELDVKTDELQKQIDTLTDFKSKWDDVKNAYQYNIDKMNATALLGSEYQKLILNNNILDVENFKSQYVSIQQQINSNKELIKSYNEKVDYYNKLKEQWQSITDEYDKQRNAQYASQVLGANWENDVLNGRLSTWNNFRNQYVSLQQAIADAQVQSANEQIKALQALADAAWASANEQINAAKEAQKAASGSTGSAGSVGSAYNVSGMISAGAPTSVINKITGNKSNTSAAATADQRKNNSNIIMSNEQKRIIAASKKHVRKYAKGGVVKINPDDLLADLAKQHGEDGFAIVQDGERILTQQQTASFDRFVDLITGMNVTPQMLMPDFTRFANGNSTDNSSVIVNIGDINLQGVQNAEQLGDAIIKRLPGYITQKFNNKQR